MTIEIISKSHYTVFNKKSGVMNMKSENLKKIVISALMAALVCVATMVIQIPSPMNGYVNLGDCFVLLSGWFLGPWYGAAAAGVGSMLTDVIAGYLYYAPGTLIIKAIMGALCAIIIKAFKSAPAPAGYIVSGLASEAVMVLGYFGYAALLLGKGSAAALSIPGNCVQAAAGLIIGTVLAMIFEKTGLKQKLFK